MVGWKGLQKVGMKASSMVRQMEASKVAKKVQWRVGTKAPSMVGRTEP